MITLALIIAGMSLAMFIKNAIREDDVFSFVFSGLIFILSAVLFALTVIQAEQPKPIDVYQGKTTLEITYKDSIAVDSVVVWK